MAAKRSQEMRNALHLIAEGVPVRIAAKTADLWFPHVYTVLREERELQGRDLSNADAAASVLRREGWDDLGPEAPNAWAVNDGGKVTALCIHKSDASRLTNGPGLGSVVRVPGSVRLGDVL